MAHTHDVYDTGKHFEINGISRFIKETSDTKLVLVQGDHNSEVITFQMPRYIDGHDMLLCNKIRVHYINLDTKTNDKSADIYEVTDLALCEECEDETLTFTWKIEAPATKYSGSLAFLIKFECTEGENILYQWNTAKYVGVNVLAGIDNGEEFVDKYSNVLEEWYNELTNGADSIEELNQQALAEIELAKEDAKEDIQGKADATMAEMNQFSSNAYNSFKNDVDKKASETLASIPEDYTEIDADVKKIDNIVYDVFEKTQNLEIYERSENILHPNTLKIGGYYDFRTGNFLESDVYNSYSNVKVDGDAEYSVRSGNYITFWDVGKNFISGINGVQTFTTPSNCAYLCISTTDTEGNYTQVLSHGNKPSTYYKPYYVKVNIPMDFHKIEFPDGYIKSDMIDNIGIDKINELVLISSTENVFTTFNSTEGCYLNENGEFVQNEGYNVTDYLYIEEGVSYKVSGVSLGGSIQCYDEDKNLIEPLSVKSGVFEIPTGKGARYVRLSYVVGDEDDGVVADTRKFPTEYVPFKPLYLIPKKLVKVETEENELVKKLILTSATANLINDIEKNGYYMSDGTWRNTLEYSSTGLIYVEEGTEYKCGGDEVSFHQIILYDKNKSFIGEGMYSEGFNIKIPKGKNAFYMRIALSGVVENAIISKKDDFPNEYVAFEPKYLLPYEYFDILKPEEDTTQEYAYHNRDKFKANPPYPLKLDMTYKDGQNQPTHPSVLYFPDGWNGHKYWMAYTPYPYNTNKYENPCITFSDDGYVWSEKGISNPIDKPTQSMYYFSDAHLIYNTSNNTLECLYRGVDMNNGSTEEFYKMYSTDGLTWGNRTRINGFVGLSPSMIYDNGIYKLWTQEATYGLNYYESSDGITFDFVRTINIKCDEKVAWHLDVVKTNKGYEFVGCYDSFIAYAKSDDNITYSEPQKILLLGYENNFDSVQLYRPCLVRKNNGIMLYYGANGLNGDGSYWGIGVVEAPSIKHLSSLVMED